MAETILGVAKPLRSAFPGSFLCVNVKAHRRLRFCVNKVTDFISIYKKEVRATEEVLSKFFRDIISLPTSLAHFV